MNNNNINNNNSFGIFDVLVLTNKFSNFIMTFTLKSLKVNYKPKSKVSLRILCHVISKFKIFTELLF